MRRIPFALLALAPVVLPAGPMSLRDATDRALLKNLGIAVTRREVGKADDAIDIAKAAFDEVITLNSGVTRGRSPGANYLARSPISDRWSNSAAITKKFSSGATVALDSSFNPAWGAAAFASPEYSTAAGVSLTQPLLRGAGSAVNLAPLARARLHLDRSRQNLRIAAADLIAETAIVYRQLAASRELLTLRETSLQSAESLLAEIRLRRRPGIGDATVQDELQAASDVESRRVELADARRAVQRAADTLANLVGDEPALSPDSPAPQVALLPDLPAPVPDFSAYMGAVDRFNPEAELRDLDIRDAETRLAEAETNDAPALDLIAGARTLGRDDSPFGAVEGLSHDHGHELAAGLRFTLPLGLREADATLRSARRSREQARLRLADTRRRTGYAARTAWRDLVAARDRLSASEAGLRLQSEAYRRERARLSSGAATVNDVLQAAARLDRARLDRLSAALDCATADLRLDRLDGNLLTRLGYRWSELDEIAGTAPEPHDLARP